MKKYKFKIGGQSYEVEIQDVEENTATLTVNGKSYTVEIEGEEAKPRVIPHPAAQRAANLSQPSQSSPASAPVASGGKGSYKIESPLPGKIKRVNVTVGSTVKAGDCLIVLEAMKMDNNIMTDKGGTVSNVKVKEGDAVLQGEVIVEIS